jgi:hypothetical protein
MHLPARCVPGAGLVSELVFLSCPVPAAMYAFSSTSNLRVLVGGLAPDRDPVVAVNAADFGRSALMWFDARMAPCSPRSELLRVRRKIRSFHSQVAGNSVLATRASQLSIHRAQVIAGRLGL